MKFSLSWGLDFIPAALLPGYSQSMSIPSKPYWFISFLASLAKLYLEAGVAAASEKPSVPQPPIAAITCSAGFSNFNCTSCLKNLGVGTYKVPSGFISTKA